MLFASSCSTLFKSNETFRPRDVLGGFCKTSDGKARLKVFQNRYLLDFETALESENGVAIVNFGLTDTLAGTSVFSFELSSQSTLNDLLYAKIKKNIEAQFPKEKRREEILSLIKALHQFLLVWYKNPNSSKIQCEKDLCAQGDRWKWNRTQKFFVLKPDEESPELYAEVNGSLDESNFVVDFFENHDRSAEYSQNELKLFFNSCDRTN